MHELQSCGSTHSRTAQAWRRRAIEIFLSQEGRVTCTGVIASAEGGHRVADGCVTEQAVGGIYVE